MTIGYLCTTTSPLISTLGLKCCLSGLGAAIHTGKSVIRAEEEEQEKRYSTQPSRLTSPPRVWLLSQHPMWRGHDRVALCVCGCFIFLVSNRERDRTYQNPLVSGCRWWNLPPAAQVSTGHSPMQPGTISVSLLTSRDYSGSCSSPTLLSSHPPHRLTLTHLIEILT